ncbi:hypothetical protein [Methylobacterium sp. SyP6R]|uniref:hypothetical protein n=1 Tax=Methylobacterium sp. SyP6R TaxID=2718876 RepID=UPI001F3FE7B4|nr:hypothetical protein [Methylobacterium sp. SyP6R]MCF4126238.1 hypothetical protein [Methylobacterium sp. SyP6R]
MRDGMRRSVGLALLLGILCAPPAWAQDPAAPRPWSDPPAKPAATEAAKPVSSPEPTAATPTRTASKKPAGHPIRTASRPRNAERAALARRKAERRDQVAVRPSRRIVADAALRPAPARRVVAARPPSDMQAARRARPLPPDLSGYRDVDLWVDSRADRIRRAQDGGFLVMRRSTIEDPMGRRMQILRPLDDEDE